MIDLTREIIIIRNKDDVEAVVPMIEKKHGWNIQPQLDAFLKIYGQYAFSVDDGMLVAALLKGELSISPLILKEHFKINSYITDRNIEGYTVCVYDEDSKEILVAQDTNGNISIAGKILFDSLKT
jgi:hypothetical protein